MITDNEKYFEITNILAKSDISEENCMIITRFIIDLSKIIQQKDKAIDDCIEYCKEKVNEVKIGGCDILTDKMFETEKRCYKDLLEKLQQAKGE